MTFADLWKMIAQQWPHGYFSLSVEATRRDTCAELELEWVCYRAGEEKITAATAEQLWELVRADRATPSVATVGLCDIMADE